MSMNLPRPLGARAASIIAALGAALGSSLSAATPALAGAAEAAMNPPANVAMVGVPDFSRITRRYGPAVVNISVTGMRQVSAGNERGADAAPGADDSSDPMQVFLRRFQQQFGGSGATMQVPVRSLGSGVIMSPDGLILTNAHVIANASEVIVKLTDRREFRAQTLGRDPKTDIAVLKIEATNLPTVVVGNPDDLDVGEWVLAIGSPFGFDNSVSVGVVSAKGRSLPDGSPIPFIQTDVAVNPGNSGGPLFNASGEVVGINSQIYSRTGGYQGVSFAVPIDVALNVQRQIVETGHVSRGVLGVATQDVNQALADAFRLPAPTGAVVLEVLAGGAGAKAGLLPGDIILQVGDKQTTTSGELAALVTLASPGRRMEFTVWRDGKPLQLTAVLDDPGKMGRGPVASAPPEAGPGLLGLALRALEAVERRMIGVATGLLVEAASGPARGAGVRPGDVVLAINGKPAASVEQARELLAGAEKSVALLILRDGERMYLAVRRP
jgi:serine protease Do